MDRLVKAHCDLQSCAPRDLYVCFLLIAISLCPCLLQWQVIWELKTFRVTAELGLVTMARNMQAYKADLEQLDLSCVHVSVSSFACSDCIASS